MKKSNKKKILSVTILTTVVCSSMFWQLSTISDAAGVVTDTLTVKVGYWGMPTEDFVEKGTYHWTELYDNLDLHYEAYSFFRDGSSGYSNKYGTVIDSAYGFYIEDLMVYAGININDINSIEFYTQDVDIGYFTSFTYSELFASERYYFNDLASYFTVNYKNELPEYPDLEDPGSDESGNVVEHESTDRQIESVTLDQNVWNDKVVVRPMLAMEDNYVTYELPAENTMPNYEGLGTGNRFRLLFGQATPTEQRTNQTAKYVHTLYVVLNGLPKITENEIELPKEIGSHQVTFHVSVEDDSLIQEAINKLKWNSSDESVLKITDIQLQPDDEYVDAVQVTINYDILKEGDVTINGSWEGFADFNSAGTTNLEFGTVAQGSNSQTPGGQDAQNPDGQDTQDQGQNQQGSSNPTGAVSGNSQQNSQGQTNQNPSQNSGENKQISGTQGDTTLALGDGSAQQAGQSNDQNSNEADDPNNSSGDKKVYALNDEIVQLLQNNNTEIVSKDKKQEDAKYEQLQVKQSKEKNMLPYLCPGAGGLLAVGAINSILQFRKRR